VREAILGAAAGLVADGGPGAVTMVAVAERAGIGRATLYKYFPDAGSVLAAWHEAIVGEHVAELVRSRDAAPDPAAALRAVLTAHAAQVAASRRHDAAALPRSAHVSRAREHLTTLLSDLIAEAAATGTARHDVTPTALADYALAALGAVPPHSDAAGRDWLVAAIMAGLAPVASTTC
jgi:AcrR family transcriptional regulator